MKSKTAVIIGGGIIGLSTAYQLARRGYGRVVVLEKDQVGDGSSGRAAGISTGLLWSETGVKARMISLRLFREMAREFPGYQFHNEHGCLNLFSPELWEGRRQLLPLYDRLGAPYAVLSPEEIHRRWPALHPGANHVGLHDPMGGYSEPSEYIPALARRVRELGAEIHEHTTVTGFIQEGGRLVGVRTAAGTHLADAVVCTVHVWTLPVLAGLGLRLPAKHFVHQRYVSAPLPEALAMPPVNADIFGGYVRPAAGNRVLLGVETGEREECRVPSTDFHMRTLSAPAGLRDETILRFSTLLPALRGRNWETEHVGLISFSADGEPILGPVAAVPGLYVGLAFHSGGFSYNPVAGQLLAEFVSEGRTSIDVSAFSPNRFTPEVVAAHLDRTVQQKDAVRRRH